MSTPTKSRVRSGSASRLTSDADAEPEQPLRAAILHHLHCTLARDRHTATRRDWMLAVSLAARDRILKRMIATQGVHNDHNVRRLYYLSLEYLMGRLLGTNLHNAGIAAEAAEVLREFDQELPDLRDEEPDMGLGNGGLGRLAACFLDSLATHDYPAVGYGIRYEYGLFRQEIVNGYQVEHPDNWVRFGNPWEIPRPEYTMRIQLGGHVERSRDAHGRLHAHWVGGRTILGVPYDIPIAGFGTRTVNFLRLWSARASEEFDLQEFNRGGYAEAVAQKAATETISKVLYPNDKTENGKELRLVQQYFFVACSLRDIIRRFHKYNNNWFDLPTKMAVQLNDTHPAIAVAELQRILVDEEGLPWDAAWSITTRTFAYTNHTLMPEALERWSVPLFERLLPRHLELIYEINQRLLDHVDKRWPGDMEKRRRLSLIEESYPKMIRMAHLAVVGSHSVNGVAAIHTQLLQSRLFPEFAELFPGRFRNVTNGITPRRWLLNCNPRLAALVSTKAPADWPRHLEKLRVLEEFADDPTFQEEYRAVKLANKVDLAGYIRRTLGLEVDPEAIFDVQIKRLHEYKRQHLNLLHILALYRRLLQNPKLDIIPRVFLFAAKAAPGYDLAKLIIKAINAVGARINADERVAGRIKVVFLPNYSVSLAQRIIPAADVSEQISTAGTEASGTGNMKLALNGALTVGTLDGANIEIREAVGPENIFIFGHTVDEVADLRTRGYNPWDLYYAHEELRACIDWLCSGYFVPGEPSDLFQPLRRSLLEHGDPFLVLADFQSYSECQTQVDRAYRDRSRWSRMAILNTARVGRFSSDRSVADYARLVWKLDPVPV